MRFRGNGRKRRMFRNRDVTCFVIFDVIISFFVNGERAEPERGLIAVKNWETHTQQASWSLGLAHGVVELTKIQRRPRRDKVAASTRIPAKAAAPPTRIPAALALPLCYRPVGHTQRVHAEDVRRTSHEHLAVSQCYGIDLCAM
jgi:hypothetical protein